MKAWIALAALLALAPLAQAGTASNPEVLDDAGDSVSSIQGLGATSVELTAAWVHAENPTDFVFKMMVGGDFEPDPTETLAYRWTVDLDGTTYEFGADVFNGGVMTTTPTGIASDAEHDGAGTMTITVPRDAFGDIAPGMRMSGFVVTTEAYVISGTIWNHSDEGVGQRSYTVGAQADPSMDFDGDGHADATEVAQGTDPTDPADPPAFTPPTVDNTFGADGGTFTLDAPSAITDTFVVSWESGLTAAALNYSLQLTEGELHLLLEDPNGVLADIAWTGSLTDGLELPVAAAGTWNATITATGFSGALSLELSPLQVEQDAPVDSGEGEGEPVDTDADHEEPTSKKTPGPAVVTLLAALGVAASRRRP